MWCHLALMIQSVAVLAQPRFIFDETSGTDLVVSMVRGGDNRWGAAASFTVGHQSSPTTSNNTNTGLLSTSKPTSTFATIRQAQTSGTSSATDSKVGSNDDGDGSYMAIVDKWRSKMQLGVLSQNSQLESNALKTAQDGNGQMVHELNPGTSAQVLAPGGAGEFEHVFVGGWLCELPDLAGLDGICGSMSQGWSYEGQTGHAQILTSTQYSKIGCALASGIWACDLA